MIPPKCLRAGKYIGHNYLLLHGQELSLITQTLPMVAKGKLMFTGMELLDVVSKWSFSVV